MAVSSARKPARALWQRRRQRASVHDAMMREQTLQWLRFDHWVAVPSLLSHHKEHCRSVENWETIVHGRECGDLAAATRTLAVSPSSRVCIRRGKQCGFRTTRRRGKISTTGCHRAPWLVITTFELEKATTAVTFLLPRRSQRGMKPCVILFLIEVALCHSSSFQRSLEY